MDAGSGLLSVRLPMKIQSISYKHALTTAPILALPDPSKVYDVVCDACGFGLGVVLMQDGQPIAFESMQQTAAEKNDSVTEQELACVHALKIWRCYLEGAAEFKIHTDHGANTFLDTQPSLSRRQARWQDFLSRFHFTWKFLPCVIILPYYPYYHHLYCSYCS